MITGQTKKSVTAAVGIIALSLGVAACSGSSGSDSGEVTTFGIATSYAPDHPMNVCGADVIQERVAEEVDGLEVEVFPSNQLGSEFDRQEQVVAGSLAMNIVGPFNAMRWHEPVGVLESAYVFDDVDHMLEVTHGEIGESLFEPLVDHGFRILDTWYFGTRQITANIPVQEPADLNGLKIRFPDAENYLANAEAMGANAVVPFPFDEVYTGLQQGVIDAQENPVSTIKSDGFWEVQDYISLTSHGIGAMMPSINEDMWQELSSEQQTALSEIVVDAGEQVLECVITDETETVEEWQSGSDITVVEDVDIQTFQEQVFSTLPGLMSAESAEVFEQIRDTR